MGPQMKKSHGKWAAGMCALLALGAFAARFAERVPGGTALVQKVRGKKTVADRLQEFGPAARARWKPYFGGRASYPPPQLLLLGLKQEKRLEIYVREAGSWRFIRALPVLAASGRLGPKLRYGDFQVPEGFYRVESLNPNSLYHLALRVSYPNESDRAQAQRDGRSELGGDIMIHGSNASIGCLAMGDLAAEDLFVLAADVGMESVQVLLAPMDFRVHEVPGTTKPPWVRALYARLKAALDELPLPPST